MTLQILQTLSTAETITGKMKCTLGKISLKGVARNGRAKVNLGLDADGVEDHVSRAPTKRDSYAESLARLNSLLNDQYGYALRRVPAHMPHLLDKRIIKSMMERFPEEFEKTSSNRFRSATDVQLAFFYFYFFMNEVKELSPSEIFDKFDTDNSGSWSDREIRTLVAQLYNFPVQRVMLKEFEDKLRVCASAEDHTVEQPSYERYLESDLPLITKTSIIKCEEVMNLLLKKFGEVSKYSYTIIHPDVTESYTSFNMITSNISNLLYSLDSIRINPKKFICLNDNLDEASDNELGEALLLDLYQSLYPHPSQFELSADFRNRFLYYEDWLAWENKRKVVSFLIFFVICILIILSLLIAKYELSDISKNMFWQNQSNYYMRKR